MTLKINTYCYKLFLKSLRFPFTEAEVDAREEFESMRVQAVS